MDVYVALFVVVTLASSVAGNPYDRPIESSPIRPEDHCMMVMERDTCMPIVEEAFNSHSGNGLKDILTHYCRYGEKAGPSHHKCKKGKGNDFEENRNDALEMINCSWPILDSHLARIWGHLLPVEEQLDLMVELLNAVNNIICNRIDEVTDFVKCIERKGRQFDQIPRRCYANHAMPLMSHVMNGTILDISTMCTVMYGYTSCLKDAAVGMCGEDYFDLLETMYEEVIVEVIGDAFDCNEENEPLFGEFKETRSILSDRCKKSLDVRKITPTDHTAHQRQYDCRLCSEVENCNTRQFGVTLSTS